MTWRGRVRRGLRMGPWLLGVGLMVVTGPGGAEESTMVDGTDRAWGVVDLHVDIPYQLGTMARPIAVGSGQFVAERAKRAGYRAVVLALFVPKRPGTQGPEIGDLERLYQRLMKELERDPVFLMPCAEPRAGRLATFLAIEGSGPLAADLDQISVWVERGVRLFGLVHADDNLLSASATGLGRKSDGLTERGREFVARVTQEGGIVDVSHASDRAALEAVEIARSLGGTVVASHSNARSVTPHPRNLPDPVIAAIGASGGVIGVNFHSPFLRKKGRATLADAVRHVRYLVDRVGVDHVAIGSDFEGGIVPALGLESAARIERLPVALRAAGFAEAEIEAILGGNAWRLLSSRKRMVKGQP